MWWWLQTPIKENQRRFEGLWDSGRLRIENIGTYINTKFENVQIAGTCAGN